MCLTTGPLKKPKTGLHSGREMQKLSPRIGEVELSAGWLTSFHFGCFFAL